MNDYLLAEDVLTKAIEGLAAHDEDFYKRHPDLPKTDLSTAADYGRLDGFRLVADLLGLKELEKKLDAKCDLLWDEALTLKHGASHVE